ncbi:MAG: hypothetical protein ACJAXJ_001471 [Colwellia sp.]|jgi:hypothetical protein
MYVEFFMVITVFNFKGFGVFVMILLLSQQSFAAFFPMNCDDMQEKTVVSHVKNSQMHEHNATSQDSMSSHEKCDVCDSDSCRCTTVGLCFGSSHTIVSQLPNDLHVLLVDIGEKYMSLDESLDSGIALHPYRPPILS